MPDAAISSLRLGLLVCDHVPERLRPVAGDYPDMFRDLFSPFPQVSLVNYDLPAGETPASTEECDAWITTGSRRSVYENEPWIGWLAEFVRRLASSDRRYVGVCFGHQMIAQALGGRVERSTNGWGVGVKKVTIPDPPSWLGVSEFRVLNSHQDQIVILPPGAEALGSNQGCPVSVVRYGERMIGIQGHPEFDRDYARALLLERRGTIIPEEVADAALDSLAEEPDRRVLAAAIVRFLSRSTHQVEGVPSDIVGG